jgi:outer membrane immunogenic protein
MRKLVAAGLVLGASAASAVAADLPTHKGPPPAPYIAPPIFTWSGFYGGINAGGEWGSGATTVSTDHGFINRAILTPTGVAHAIDFATGANAKSSAGAAFIFGAQAGYNWQFSSIVAGFETDIQGFGGSSKSGSVTNLAQTAACETPVSVTVSGQNRLDYIGTVRGRAGYLFTPTLLAYATGGLAYGGVKSSASVSGFETVPGGTVSTPTSGSSSNTRVGWTLGAGVEWMLMANWSVKAEYMYYDLGRATYALPPFVGTAGGGATAFSHTPVVSARYDGNLARLGLNYHF